MSEITLADARRRCAAREVHLPLASGWPTIAERLSPAQRAYYADDLAAAGVRVVDAPQLPFGGEAAAGDADPDEVEKVTQAKVVKRFRAFGFKVYNLSQARRTKQTPGLSDLWITHRRRGLALWWETKRPLGGRFSSEQLDFRDECTAAGVSYGAGDERAAEEWLIAHGIAYRTPEGTLEPVRREGVA